ncbi:lanthionine synthetase C family protein [Streptosporangium saharense]|uniref:lanthionine synthetase C family protein n=1 Tax=Streptosporangium saharense TaxID=1706840 RepID=UPI0036C61367
MNLVEHSAAEEMAAQLADALADPPVTDPAERYGPDSPRWNGQSLSEGATGIAILHGVRAQAGLSGWGRVRAWLSLATEEEVSAGPGAGLWHGAPALAFSLSVVVRPGEDDQLMKRLDTVVASMTRSRLQAAEARMASAQRPDLGEFDLVHGLTGFGAFLLRRDPYGDLVRHVLAYLVRLTEPIPADDPASDSVPGWWTLQVPTGKPEDDFLGGHSDHGMAHGITGPLALLATSKRAGVTVDGQMTAIDRICAWLDTHHEEGPTGPWWPERLTHTELQKGRSSQGGPARPSWCYGAPGITRALQLAGLALGDRTRQRKAEEALLRCVTDPVQLNWLEGPSLCHGWAGVTAVTWFAAVDALTPALRDRLPFLMNSLIEHAHRKPSRSWTKPGLIDGTAGAALILHTIATQTTEGWERNLLIN